MNSSFFKIYEKLVLHRPWISILGLVSLAAAMAFGLPNFKLDASADSLTLETR
jgi:hypothetical protein